jgi:hypothetical protein
MICHMNPVHTFPPSHFKVTFIISFPVCAYVAQESFFLQIFKPEFFISHLSHAKSHAHFILKYSLSFCYLLSFITVYLFEDISDWSYRIEWLDDSKQWIRNDDEKRGPSRS